MFCILKMSSGYFAMNKDLYNSWDVDWIMEHINQGSIVIIADDLETAAYELEIAVTDIQIIEDEED